MSYNKTTTKKFIATQPIQQHRQHQQPRQNKATRQRTQAEQSSRKEQKKWEEPTATKKTAPKSRQTDRKKNEKCVHLTAKRSNRAVTARTSAQCFDAAAGPARHAVVDQNSAYRDVDAKCRRLLFGITCVVASVCMRVRACVNSCSSSTLPCSHLTTTGKNNNNS